MAEQLPLFKMDPHPRGLDLKPHQTASPEVVSGPDGDIILYNVSTNFRGMMNAHKKSYMDKDDPVESAYTKLIPSIDKLPEPDERFPASLASEQVVENGIVSEDVPFIAGVRIALLERRARDQHRKAQKFLRRVRVGHDAAKGVLTGYDFSKDNDEEGEEGEAVKGVVRWQDIEEGKDKKVKEVPIYYSSPEKKYRPQTLLENAAAKRMGRLLMRANSNNSLTNVLEEVSANDDGSARIVEQDNNDTSDSNLSVFERLHRDSTRQLHDKRAERSKRMMEGTRIPIIDKRVNLFSFKTLAAGGPDKPLERAKKALKKRDDALRKAEALRQPNTKRGEEPTDELSV